MAPVQVVLDTNVLVAALRSARGASFRLVSRLETAEFEINLSVPLLVEHESVLQRKRSEFGLSEADIGDFLDYLCGVARLHEIHFLWRPFLPDPKDEMVLEVAVKARCRYIVTYNIRDFRGVERFGIEAVTARQLLDRLEEVR